RDTDMSKNGDDNHDSWGDGKGECLLLVNAPTLTF
ncbi:hypothetical protein Tco_1127212, partial [Tanacetum coccineum]